MDDHPRAPIGEGEGDCPPDPPGGAGDQSDVGGEIRWQRCHRVLPAAAGNRPAPSRRRRRIDPITLGDRSESGKGAGANMLRKLPGNRYLQ